MHFGLIRIVYNLSSNSRILDQIKQLDKLIAKQREMIIRSRSQFEAELDTEVFGRFLEQSIIKARLICCFFCGKQHPIYLVWLLRSLKSFHIPKMFQKILSSPVIRNKFKLTDFGLIDSPQTATQQIRLDSFQNFLLFSGFLKLMSRSKN